MKIEQWPISKPKPYAQNACKISEAAIAKVARSIQEFGFRQPIVVDAKGVIVAGHTRLLAARSLKLKTVPVHVAADLTPEQVRQFRIMDNRSHDEAEWDFDILNLELADMKSLDLDLSMTGFDIDELAEIMADKSPGLTDEDAVPDAPIVPVTQLGDVWLLGNHRVLCGDSTVATDVERVLAGVKPLLMVTDPPYGVNYDSDWRLRAGINKWGQKLANGKVRNDDRSDWREAWILFPGDVCYVWHGALHAANVAESLEASGFQIRSQIVWAKSSLVIGRGNYHWQHEPCWYAVKNNGHWHGDRKQATLWNIANIHRTQGNVDDGKTNHSTQKPVECMRRPIVNNSAPGQPVYDPFLGSGTTVVAAETEGRICYGIELEPIYVDVIVQRWQNFTGKEATLEGHGATFAHVKAGRLMQLEDELKESILEAAV